MNPPGSAPGGDDAAEATGQQKRPPAKHEVAPTSANVPNVPDYELLWRVGGGAYGDVWLARSKATGTLRAAKIVWKHWFEDERPFRREFEGIQRFEQISREHPSQLALFHIGRNDAEGYFYYVMELADDATKRAGEDGGLRMEKNAKAERAPSDPPSSTFDPHQYSPHTLRAEIERGRLPAVRVLEIGLALAEALSHLHQHGLVHRDVKPSNVIFVNGRPKLADIGLVTDASDQCSIVGTEGYLPPEGPGTPQADIFALGKVLYEGATGLDRRDYPKLPEDLRTWPDAAQVFELNEVILKACESDVRNRYHHCGEALDDLAHMQQGRSVLRRRIWGRRVRAARSVGIAAVAIMLAAAGGVFVWQTVRPQGAPVTVLDESGEALSSHDTGAVDAYRLGLRALGHGTPTDIRLAQDNFNKAIEIDPRFVNAYGRLVEIYLKGEDYGGPAIPGKTEMLNMLSAKLHEIAPTDAETHAAAGIVKFLNEWRWKEAEADFKEALRINPNCRLALTYYGYFLTRLRRSAEARVVLERANRLDRTSPEVEKLLGHCDYAEGRFDEALNHYLKAEELDARYASTYYWAGRACMALTNYSEALRQLQDHDVLVGLNETNMVAHYDRLRKAVEADPRQPGHAFWSALIQEQEAAGVTNSLPYLWAARYARVGDVNQAANYLDKAVKQRDNTVDCLLFDECWEPYRREQWFKSVVKEVGLDPLQ